MKATNASVAIIDADPNKPVSQWAGREGNPAEVSNLAGAIENARAFAAELVAMLREVAAPLSMSEVA